MTVYFESISEFFAMGGHGFYVWSCYLIVFIALLSHIVSLVRGLKSQKKLVARHIERVERSSNK